MGDMSDIPSQGVFDRVWELLLSVRVHMGHHGHVIERQAWQWQTDALSETDIWSMTRSEDV